jgi:diaminopimelate epimerase
VGKITQKLDKYTSNVKVNIGKPQVFTKRYNLYLVPDNFSKGEYGSISIDGKEWKFTKISVGNPHCVIFVENFDFDYCSVGKLVKLININQKIENHQFFSPEKTNVEFIQIISPSEMNFRVWERGSGETWSCGTGACASVVASSFHQFTDRNVLVHLKGGDLEIEWTEDDYVWMTGLSTSVFQGKFFLS